MEYPELESIEPECEDEVEVLFDEDQEVTESEGWWGDDLEDSFFEEKREVQLFGGLA